RDDIARSLRTSAQSTGCVVINGEARQIGDDDAIILARSLDRNEAILHVPQDLVERPVMRIAVAAAARIHVGDGIARYDGLKDVLAFDIGAAVAFELDAPDFGVDELR